MSKQVHIWNHTGTVSFCITCGETNVSVIACPGRHPFIKGLLRTLPDPDSVWPLDQRKKWLETAENIFSLIYKDTPAKHVPAEPKKPE